MRSPLVEPSPDAVVDCLFIKIAATGRVSWNNLDTLIRYVQDLREGQEDAIRSMHPAGKLYQGRLTHQGTHEQL